ncbi:unnamed protein product [Caenorhabditis angaria]|uniref:Wbp11/ELF5/Saf1 N-terminal domain-containing protein n=1 Tax=Caenorhabditis angaria TaxID=860376 RepID=A0A9P1ICN7_9PELO|nr:unnamed protein product [Caenorhabditis angaria]
MLTISKTKGGGRFRAPTDQARKQDRKRENKRNKKDRQQIRQAMAKFCNLEETTSKLLLLERQVLGLDPQPFHIDVLKKKQKVLTDLINKRRMTLQQAKDDEELKKFNEKLQIYHADCKKLAVLAEQARLARETLPEMIPLPSGDMLPPLPQQSSMMPVKKKVDFQLPSRAPRSGQKPPGPPCGVAPEYSDDEEDMIDEPHFDEDDLGPVPIPEFEQRHHPVYPPMYRNRKFLLVCC